MLSGSLQIFGRLVGSDWTGQPPSVQQIPTTTAGIRQFPTISIFRIEIEIFLTVMI